MVAKKKVSATNLPSSPPKKAQDANVIEVDLWSCSPDGTPLRPIICVKTRDNVREVEKREDCFILDFDPDDRVHFDISKPSVPNNNLASNVGSPDVSVVAEKGQVACRDYPHSRHFCLKYPFEKTPHDNYCELCYCFVCDLAAPCKNWTGVSGHCHAVDNEAWKHQRKLNRNLIKT